jgi:hypothetical protein
VTRTATTPPSPTLTGETSHADLFNAWDEAAQARLVKQCLDAGRKCGPTGR